ncbi:MAG: DegT/DnrJ/EryC1/StrS family aminotransferase [Elusimicrobia bacterium]|nr:DegT/DnrJ/EryC1/StrS family aminotransferase [Elusimicrobiota bacterium]
MTKIPFFGATREFQKHGGPILKEVGRIFKSGRMLQGPEVASFEEKLARFTNRRLAVALNSATDALYFALAASGIGPGDEVLVTDFSFIASGSAICRAGATPIFIDIDDTYNIDLKQAQAKITPQTKALVAVHLYGSMMNPRVVNDFSRRHNLVLIEDAAQAIGAAYDSVRAGSLGLASVFSFDPTKPISAPGSGGVLLTDDETLAAKVKRLRYHGKETGQNSYREIGINSQMPSATAAVLNFKMTREAAWRRRRQDIAARYIRGLAQVPGLVLPGACVKNSHIYHKFVIRIPNRDALKEQLSKAGIETMIHYSTPLHRQPCFAHLGLADRDYPVTNRFAQSVLSLPIHPFLKDSEVNLVISSIVKLSQTKTRTRAGACVL